MELRCALRIESAKLCVQIIGRFGAKFLTKSFVFRQLQMELATQQCTQIKTGTTNHDR